MTTLETSIGKLKIKEGITKSQVKELIHFSNSDSLIQKFTTDQVRFKDVVTYNKRLKNKIRTYYTLSDDGGKLLGITWFGPKNMPDWFDKKPDYEGYIITFAIRLYDGARGIGIGHIFLSETLNLYLNSPQYKDHGGGKLWCLLEKSNKAAVRVYKKSGFRSYNKNEGDKILMLRH